MSTEQTETKPEAKTAEDQARALHKELMKSALRFSDFRREPVTPASSAADVAQVEAPTRVEAVREDDLPPLNLKPGSP